MNGDFSTPNEQKCPNCGTMAPVSSAICPRCGMALNAPSKTIYGCAIVLFQVFLGLMALVFGASGAFYCYTWFGIPAQLDQLNLLLIGVLLFCLAAACIWSIVRISKARKKL